MAEINWGLLPQNDFARGATTAYRAGVDDRQAKQQEQALTTYAQDPRAGIKQLMPVNPQIASRLQDREDERAAAQAAKAEDDQKKALAQRVDTFKTAAGLLKQTPVEARKARLQSMYPAFKATGVGDDIIAQLDGADLSDASLDVFTGELAKAAEQYTLAPGSKRFDANGKLIAEAPFAPEYRTVGEGQSLVQLGGGAAIPSAAGFAPKGGFDGFYSGYLKPAEGGYASNDGNGQPVNFGINQGSNPDVDVSKLTPDRAKQLTYERYWKPSGADQLPPGLAEVHADTAFNMGQDAAQKLLKASGGDVNRYFQLRENRYKAIAQANPDKAKYLPTWMDRNERLKAYVGGGSAQTNAGGATVIAQGAPKPQVRTLTPAEVEAAGFLPGTIVQQRPDGSYNTVQAPNNQASPRKAEADLRKEFNARAEVKEFKQVQGAYNQIQAIAAKPPTAAGDMSMIFSYMKMLDPGSVVREGEFANAQNAAGVPDRVVNAYNKALSGQMLNPNQRQDFARQATTIFGAQEQRYRGIADEYRGYASDYGVDPNRVVSAGQQPKALNKATPPAGAQRGKDGNYYVQDPNKPGSFPQLRQGKDGVWRIKSANGQILRWED